MAVLLYHNPTAGRGDHTRDGLIKLVAGQAHDVRYRDIKRDGIEPADASGMDVVVIAGGDGTVGKVLHALRYPDLQVAILPLGTANNVARSLGLPLDAAEAVAVLGSTVERRVDLGIAKGSWGSRVFLEGVGLGALAEMMRTGKGSNFEDSEKRRFSAEAPQRFVRAAKPQDWQLRVDGRELPGDLYMAEVLNMPIIGPNLPLAPIDCLDDGRLWLYVLPRDGQEAFATWLSGPRQAPPAGLATLKAERIEFVWSGGAIRIDDCYPEPPSEPEQIGLEIAPQKLRVLLPREGRGVKSEV